MSLDDGAEGKLVLHTTEKTNAELQLNKHRIELAKAKIELSILTGNMP